jgi:hypothetical protein
MLKSDRWIREQAAAGMIEPFVPGLVRHVDIGSLTVLDRMTGFGFRDTETGFRAPDGAWWLASGDHDVRLSGALTLGEAIEWVKRNSQHSLAPTATREGD